MHFSTLRSVYLKKKSSHRLLLKTADDAKPKSTLSGSELLLPLLLPSMSTSHIVLRSRQVKERRGSMNNTMVSECNSYFARKQIL